MNIRLTEYTPAQGRTLQALLRVVLVDVGIEIRDIGLHESDGKRWVVMPRRKIVSQGDYRFLTFVLFQDQKDFQIFSQHVLDAVARHKGGNGNGGSGSVN
jgi:hypothetical protein